MHASFSPMLISTSLLSLSLFFLFTCYSCASRGYLPFLSFRLFCLLLTQIFPQCLSQTHQTILGLTLLFNSALWPGLQFTSCSAPLKLPHSQIYKANACILLFFLVFYWCQSRSPSPHIMWKLFTKRVVKIQMRVKKMCDPYPKCKCSKETVPSLIQYSPAKY